MLDHLKNYRNSFYPKLATITTGFLLASLIIAPIMKAHAGDSFDRMSDDLSDRPSGVDPGQGDPANHPGPLAPYFNMGCALYGIDDFLLNDSYFFCVNNNGFSFFNFFIPDGDYEGLDYDKNRSKLLYASAGDDAVPSIFNGDILNMIPILDTCNAIPFASLGPVVVDGQAMEEVDGIAFDNVGNLYGWAQEAGLFRLGAADVATSSLDKGIMVLDQPGEVEDIEIVDNCIVGLLNIDHFGQAEDGDGEPHPNHPIIPEDVNVAVDDNGVFKANYVRYCPGANALDTPCEQQVIDALQQYQAAEIEAIEVLPPLPGEQGTKVLLGFHTNSGIGFGNGNPPPGSDSYNTLMLGVLDISNCSLQTQAIYEIPRNIAEFDNIDVEGLAMVCPADG
jgi:hypothetical protein